MMNENLITSVFIVFMCVNVALFFIGILIAIISQKNKKFGVKLLIGSVISFVIGFGGCLAYITSLN